MISSPPKLLSLAVSRRTFLGSAAAASVATAWPRRGLAQATRTRKSLQGGNASQDVETYAEAVKAMLELPPQDPRNWYRNALTHVMDCPHGNWWFLAWHRGYLAHLENICRELTNTPNFALPFWDWTNQTEVPDRFWHGVLTPAAPDYESNSADFTAKFRGPVEGFWNALSSDQMAQQMIRGSSVPPVVAYSDFDEFWDAVEFHFNNGIPRGLTEANPDLSTAAKNAVSEQMILDALQPAVFVQDAGTPGFESGVSANHHGGAGKAIIESQPHDQVHGSISGLMGRWLSPVDPMFFMHHCNIDRLWDVWTRKQLANGRPIGPPTAFEGDYYDEDFLFFHDAAGDPATMTKARDYSDVATFDYDYEDGTGETTVQPIIAQSQPISDEAEVENAAFDLADPATSFVVPGEELAARLAVGEQRFFATVRIEPPEDVRGLEFQVFIGKADADIDFDDTSRNFAGAVGFFGDVAHAGMGTANFDIGITETVRQLRADGELSVGDAIRIAVVPKSQDNVLALSGNAEGALAGASIGSF